MANRSSNKSIKAMNVKEAEDYINKNTESFDEEIKKLGKKKPTKALQKKIDEMAEAWRVYWEGGFYYLDHPKVFNKLGQAAEVKSDYLDALVNACKKRGLVYFTIKDREGKEYRYGPDGKV